MQVFPRETTEYIAEQLYLYYQRRLSIKEAVSLVEYVQNEGSHFPSNIQAIDYSKSHIKGGGRGKPSEEYICRIIEKIEDRSLWDAVFSKLERMCEREPDAEKVLLMAFRDRLKDTLICEKMHIYIATYYRYRTTILNRATVLAIEKGLIKFSE